jgi:hypothetical protein
MSLAFGFMAKILSAFLSFLLHVASYVHFILLHLWDKSGVEGIAMTMW